MTRQRRALRILLSVLLLVGLTNGLRAQAPAAIVNGESITMAEVDAILNARPLRFVKLTDADKREMQRDALDMLIDDVLLRQFLRKNAPAVPAAEVNKKILELRSALKGQSQSMDEYLHETGQTEAQLRTNVLTMMQRNAYLNGHLGDDAVRKYYDDHRGFFDQQTVRASHLLFRLTTTMTPAERNAARVRLLTIRQDIVSGKISFADAARRWSECPSAANGGDIGSFLRKGSVEESFASAAFALKADEVSDVVQTSYGLHLIKVTERKTGTPSDFKKIEAKVRQFAGEEMLRDALAQERQVARIDIKLGDSHAVQGTSTERQSPLGGHRP
jgi:parvulin-like peptidyl-prolyl isomerase